MSGALSLRKLPSHYHLLNNLSLTRGSSWYLLCDSFPGNTTCPLPHGPTTTFLEAAPEMSLYLPWGWVTPASSFYIYQAAWPEPPSQSSAGQQTGTASRCMWFHSPCNAEQPALPLPVQKVSGVGKFWEGKHSSFYHEELRAPCLLFPFLPGKKLFHPTQISLASYANSSFLFLTENANTPVRPHGFFCCFFCLLFLYFPYSGFRPCFPCPQYFSQYKVEYFITYIH